MNSWEYTLYATPVPAEKLNTLDGLESCDKNVAYSIKRAEEIIDRLKEVRRQYAQRAAEIQKIESGNGVHWIALDRIEEYGGKVTYTLRHTIEYPGFKHIKPVSSETFAGKDRWEAIKMYKRLEKEHPGFNFTNNFGIR